MSAPGSSTFPPELTPNLVLIRHGQSDWNLQNRFTGWVDVELSPAGVEEARRAGRQIAAAGIEFDRAWTSVLKRAIHTLWIVLEELDAAWLPVERRWRLNERHYGALQGLNKAETAAQHGDEQVQIWRRSYDIPLPPLDERDPSHPRLDRRYAEAAALGLVPASESLRDTLERVLPCWEQELAPALQGGERLLIAAHGNSLRALVKHIEGMGNAEISELNIPTGMPLAYALDERLNVRARGYLGDAAEVAAAAAQVAAQGRAGGGLEVGRPTPQSLRDSPPA